jgi:hypothetical protein
MVICGGGNSSQKTVLDEVTKTHEVIQTLDKTISSLEMEPAVARAQQSLRLTSIPQTWKVLFGEPVEGQAQKAFVVIGINIAFSSRKKRDSVQESWMPHGENLKQLEKEKGIVIRFMIGHSATLGGILDCTIEAEDAQHLEGYHELSMKTKIYFATAVSEWDADFYVKVDVHVNLGMLGTTLAQHHSKPYVLHWVHKV